MYRDQYKRYRFCVGHSYFFPSLMLIYSPDLTSRISLGTFGIYIEKEKNSSHTIQNSIQRPAIIWRLIKSKSRA